MSMTWSMSACPITRNIRVCYVQLNLDSEISFNYNVMLYVQQQNTRIGPPRTILHGFLHFITAVTISLKLLIVLFVGRQIYAPLLLSHQNEAEQKKKKNCLIRCCNILCQLFYYLAQRTSKSRRSFSGVGNTSRWTNDEEEKWRESMETSISRTM